MTILSLAAHGHTLKMHAQPGKIAKCWRAGRPYEAPLLERIRELGVQGTAVDAGANFGNHTLWFAVVCGLEVHAFEPQAHQADVLRRNVALNDLEGRVHVHRVALGKSAGSARLIEKGRFAVGNGETPVKPLDDFDLRGVSVIKADVEDMEPDVLAGGERTIRRDRPVIYAEAHPGRHEHIAQVIEPWGYRRTGSYNAKESVSPVEEWQCQT